MEQGGNIELFLRTIKCGIAISFISQFDFYAFQKIQLHSCTIFYVLLRSTRVINENWRLIHLIFWLKVGRFKALYIDMSFLFF